MVLKIKFKVPESTASIFKIVSPEFTKSFKVVIIGSPAPTLVSKRNLAPLRLAVFFNRA
jgi:hypothetical protein